MEHSSHAPVSVIIPTWNQEALVRKLLENLQQQTTQPQMICVVDNGSTDGTVQAAESLGARVLCLRTNQGFAAAVNAGIATATSDWVLVLNNDVELDKRWIAEALQAAQEENAQFAAGKLLQANNPERLDGTWDLVSQAGCAWRCGWNALDGQLWNKRRPIQIASFTALLVHRSVFERVGLLDVRYQSYYEDVDFGLRCALAGFKGVYEPQAIAKHLGSATLGRGPHTSYLISRNQVLLAHKFGLARLSWARVIWGQFLFLLTRIRERTLLSALKGKWDGLRIRRFYPQEAVNRKQLLAILGRNEKEILHFQQLTRFDLSWKLYFRFLHGRYALISNHYRHL